MYNWSTWDKVFWLVGPGLRIRHAVAVHPHALPHGEFVPTACERWIQLPYSTPFFKVPASRAIQEKCSDCTVALEDRKPVEVVWDS